jgi:TolB protein
MIRLKRLIGALLTAVVTMAMASGAHAELQVDITRGNLQPLPIAITDFYGQGQKEQEAGRDIASVISADLERSGLFKPVDKRAFLQDLASLQVQPRFADWRVINAQALVNGAVTVQPDGRLKVEFRLWDVFAEAQMAGLQYRTQRENWRRVAHIIADAIYKRITGEEGYFDTRIVYVAESGPATRRIKRLAIMDQDGANHRYLTDGRSLVLTPRFSRTTQEITYLSYYNNTPRVYIFNIETGRQEVLGSFQGMTFAPRFAPSGNSVIMSYAENGNSDIYTMDLRTRKTKRLTSNPAIDTSPCYAPDAKRIVFNSDRGGSPQIYVMNADGSNVQRISFGPGWYLTPVWSPRGDLIAFTKQYNGKFFIGVMRPDGSGERLLSESYLEEAPTWAPNGRVLMFYRQQPMDKEGGGGGASLYTVDLTGHNLRRVVTPGSASDPAWSSLIP